MNVEEFKKEVERHLIEDQKCTEEYKDFLMKQYDEDFEDFVKENWEPRVVAFGMAIHYL